MSDQFDKELVNRIKEVFDKYEDDSAQEGWEALRKRFPEKKKKRSVVWWYGSAAAILLLAGIWLMADNLFLPNNVQQNAHKKEQKQPDSKQKQAIREPSLQLSNNTNTQTGTAESLIAKISDNELQNNMARRIQAKKSILPSKKASKLAVKAEEDLSSFLADTDIPTAQEQPKTDLTIIALSPNSSKKKQSGLSLAGDSAKSEEKLQTVATKPSNNEPLPGELPGEQLAKLIEHDAGKENIKPGKNVTLSFYAGSYFNYADGSENSVNTALGFTSDIKLAKRLKLSTGISLGRNSLTYQEAIPQNVASSFARSHQTLLTPHSFDSPAEGKTSLVMTTPIQYSLNSYDAKLTGFDIPINLKYTLLDKKNTIYVSSGISSNLFINESYTYSFGYQVNGTNTSKAPNEESSANFQSFDFARVLNFSFGFDYPVSKQTRISFEPFIKYPLSGLGVENLRFSAAGINLKFNFNHLK